MPTYKIYDIHKNKQELLSFIKKKMKRIDNLEQFDLPTKLNGRNYKVYRFIDIFAFRPFVRKSNKFVQIVAITQAIKKDERTAYQIYDRIKDVISRGKDAEGFRISENKIAIIK